MKRVRIYAIATLVVLACGGVAHAEWFAHFRRNALRNNAWPDTFCFADRDAVRAPFAIMAQNGWRSQNTFGRHHFRDGTAELTEAGRMKLKWIVTEVAEPYRMIYVERAESPDLTEQRMLALRILSSEYAPEVASLDVRETTLPVRGWPAAATYKTYQDFFQTSPPPRLPSSTSGGGSSGGN